MISKFNFKVQVEICPKFMFKILIVNAQSRDETTRSSISHGLVSKIKPNLPILGIYNELSGIMVNKGIKVFSRYLLEIDQIGR